MRRELILICLLMLATGQLVGQAQVRGPIHEFECAELRHTPRTAIVQSLSIADEPQHVAMLQSVVPLVNFGLPDYGLPTCIVTLRCDSAIYHDAIRDHWVGNRDPDGCLIVPFGLFYAIVFD